MPPNPYYNRILFKPIHPRSNTSNETRKNRVYKMTHPENTIGPIETQKNRIYRILNKTKTKPKLTRNTRGMRNLISNHTLKKVDFSNMVTKSNTTQNFLQNEKNTRGKVNPKQWNSNLQSYVNSVRNYQNEFLSTVNQPTFNALTNTERNAVESISRFSEPKSNSYRRPYQKERFNVKGKWSTNENAVRNKARVNYGPKEAKMMANITAKYNNPIEMLDAVEALNLSDDMKEKFTNDITSMYSLYNSE